MLIAVGKEALGRALSLISKVVDARSTIPILEHVVFSASGDVVSARGTDMDIEALVTIADATVAHSGEAAIPARMLHDIVRTLPKDCSIDIETSGIGHVAIRSGASAFKLPVLRPDDYPIMRVSDILHRFALPAETLRTLIDRVCFAISTEETRYYLNGIYLHATESGDAPVIRAVATDGHRLARFEMNAPEGAADMPGIIVPLAAVDTVRSMIAGRDGDIDIAVGANIIQFSIPGVILTSKLIDGTYPEYERVIPRGRNNSVAEVSKEALADAVKRVKPIASRSHLVAKFSFSRDGLFVSARGEDGAEAADGIDCLWGGPDMDIGLNIKYVADNLDAIAGETVHMTIIDPESPILISDPDDKHSLFVLMVARLP
jgi:DNA polymerase-3 subunit beta